MNEEIEYAEMLEIPVSTVNVVRKNRRRKKNATAAEATVLPPTDTPLKDSVIAQVNSRLDDTPIQPEPQIHTDTDVFAENANGDGHIDFETPLDRIDTVRLYSTEGKRSHWKKNRLSPENYQFETENDLGRYELNEKSRASKAFRIALSTEFAVACALCGAIFLTNVFMPNSAINTFFRALNDPTAQAATDARSYSDFTLSPVVSELSDAELTLSPAGILSFTDECCVYPAANGKVNEVISRNGETYSVKIQYSDSFTGVINGLSGVYYNVGDEVKANVPVGYTSGETEVQVTMYSDGLLLNCFELTEENCLAWISADENV